MVSPIGLVEEEQKGGLTTKWLFFTFRKGKDCTLAKFQSHKQETKICKKELWMTSESQLRQQQPHPSNSTSENQHIIDRPKLLKFSQSVFRPQSQKTVNQLQTQVPRQNHTPPNILWVKGERNYKGNFKNITILNQMKIKMLPIKMNMTAKLNELQGNIQL